MFLRMHSLLFYLHSKCLMLDAYPTFRINQPPHHHTFRSAYGSFVLYLKINNRSAKLVGVWIVLKP